MNPASTTFDRALWRSMALPFSENETPPLVDLIERGARPDASFPDALVGRVIPTNALDRLLCHAPASALASRLRVLFGGGLDPAAAALGWEACIAACREDEQGKEADATVAIGWSDLVHRLSYLTAGTHDAGLLATLVVGAMTSPLDASAAFCDALEVALSAGVSPVALPGVLSPLAILIEHRGGASAPIPPHPHTAQAFLDVGQQLMLHGASFDEPCAHLSSRARLALGQRTPQTLRDWVGLVLASGEPFECAEALSLLLNEG